MITKREVINGLKDLIKDRESFTGEIFRHDIAILKTAILMITKCVPDWVAGGTPEAAEEHR